MWCAHCGADNWDFRERCKKCGKLLRGEKNQPMKPELEQESEIAGIAEAIERNASATERIYSLLLAITVISFMALAFALVLLLSWRPS
jgi:uncharacterized membrane protein YvbJ